MADDNDEDMFADDLDADVVNIAVQSFQEQERSRANENYEELEGFRMEEGNWWVYPVNYPLRSYQFNIVQKALFWNTLVTLPTGLGKTFVAAVVIYNFYRWYPKGKILFLAPTKPLVAQQIRACHDIVGIPQSDLGELTGNINAARREKVWKSKRVFFLTPQTVQNDMSHGTCPAEQVVLVVIDEAHRATGNHAYCQVIRELQNYKTNFRVLALSATPGDNLNTVQAVLTNLLIAHVEIRSEESLDIMPYTHSRQVNKIVLPLDQPLDHLKTNFIDKVLVKYVHILTSYKALYCTDPANLSKFTLLQQRASWRTRDNNPPHVSSCIEGTYVVLMNLYHAFELLLIHGAAVFVQYCVELLEGKKGTNSTKGKLLRDQDFLSLIDTIRRWRNLGVAPELDNARFVDHPKLPRLIEILTEHFSSADEQTRAMVFSSYRDSVQDLVKKINAASPILKSAIFIGQGGPLGLKQREQLATVTKFKEGAYNVLVATCVGEEGLDIGMVDLIVNYDASASSTRLVQRMGRAARKRAGAIHVLLTQGKEENTYKKSIASKNSVSKAVMTKLNKLVLYANNPRMIPKHLNPKPDKRVLAPVEFKTPPPKLKQKTLAQKKKCPFLSSTQYNSYVASQSNERCLNKSVGFSLSDCLDKWVHYQGTEHPTFNVEHSMSTLTLVHVMTVNDLFRAQPKAIDKYEEEMAGYLNLDDVIVPKHTKSLEVQQKRPKATKATTIVVDDEDFEGVSLKQSKLNFSLKPKQSLFSCLPKNEPSQTLPVIDLEKSDDENVNKVEVEDDFTLEHGVDVQHDVSFEDPISQRFYPNTDRGKSAEPVNVDDDLPRTQLENLKDLKEDELTDSMYEAINETWDLELSKLEHIPPAPAEVPLLTDMSIICSQKPSSPPLDMSIICSQKPSSPPLVPKNVSLGDQTGDFDDVTLDDIDINEGSDLFKSLARIEKQHTEKEDDAFENEIDPILPEPSFKTPAKPFKPLQSSTPGLLPQLSNLSPRKHEVSPVTSVEDSSKQQSLLETPKIFPKISEEPTNTSAEDSPLIVGKRKRRCNILGTQADHTANAHKKSRSDSPAKNVTVNYTKGKGRLKKCQFVDDEADLSGSDDDGFDKGTEDVMSSSLEDFIDGAEDQTNNMTLYLRDIATSHQQNVRKVGGNFQGNVYSQQPSQDVEETGEFDSFICDDEEFSLLDDDFETTAVFTQRLNQSQDILPNTKKRTRRVKDFEESPLVTKNEHITPKRDVITTPRRSTKKLVDKSVTGKTGNDSGNVSSFLLGLDDLLSDLEDEETPVKAKASTRVVDDDDDDFEASSFVRPSKPGTSVRKQSAKSQRAAKISQSNPEASMELFGDTLDASAIEAACRSISSHVTKVPDEVTKQGVNASLSQFHMDLDDLLPDGVVTSRDGVVTSRGGVVTSRGGVVTSRGGVVTSRDGVVTSRGGVVTSRDGVVTSRGGVVTSRGGVVTSRGGVVTSRGGVVTSRGGPSKTVNKKPLIFVRTKVISNNQICSILRTKHNLRVEIRTDLVDCDYVVNVATAVLRITGQDVCKSLPNLLARCGDLHSTFEHIVLIAELPSSDNIKKKLLSKGYQYDPVRFAVAAQQLRHYRATLLVSHSHEETSAMIARFSSTAPNPGTETELTEKQKHLNEVLNTIPCLNHANARLLALKYANIAQLINSTADQIRNTSFLTRRNTALLIKYLKTIRRDKVKL